MIESYKQAIEEFKRVDHLYYVTLKYTRTVDVIRSTIERLISTFEYAVDAFLKCLKEEKVIGEIPMNPVGKVELAQNNVKNEDINRYMTDYLFLRRVMREDYTKREEFRRHVTMTVLIDNEEKEFNIDVLKEYYDDTRLFLTFVKEKVSKHKDD